MVDDKSRVGVCIDTCHTFAAGYDLRTAEACETTFAEFDKVVGLNYLRAMHINDSMKPFGSKVDRHNNIGKGEIGIECFKWIMQQDMFDDIPLILETPDESIWAEEIALLRRFETEK